MNQQTQRCTGVDTIDNIQYCHSHPSTLYHTSTCTAWDSQAHLQHFAVSIVNTKSGLWTLQWPITVDRTHSWPHFKQLTPIFVSITAIFWTNSRGFNFFYVSSPMNQHMTYTTTIQIQKYIVMPNVIVTWLIYSSSIEHHAWVALNAMEAKRERKLYNSERTGSLGRCKQINVRLVKIECGPSSK